MAVLCTLLSTTFPMSDELCKPIRVVDKAKKLIRLGPGEGHKQTASVLMLHGFGDNASGWFEPALEWAQRLPHVRFVLPTAPFLPEMGATAWFSFSRSPTKEAMVESLTTLEDLVQEEARVVGLDRIVVAGFSQGGVMAYELGLTRMGQRVAGIAALSTWLPPFTASRVSDAGRSTPMIICHGSEDDRVGGSDSAKKAQKELVDSGVKVVELHIYNMGHNACEKELNDILNWLQRIIPAHVSHGASKL